MTRNPLSAQAKASADSGVEIVQADLNDTESLKAAFKGADYIFAYTDYDGIATGPGASGNSWLASYLHPSVQRL